jgi:hypothetical protein
MREEIAKLWAASLEREKYQQGEDYLLNDARYSVFGVLCDLSGICKWQAKPDTTVKQYDGLIYSVSERVKVWSGLQSTKGYIPSRNIYLVDLNDDRVQFPELACYIRKHWKEL